MINDIAIVKIEQEANGGGGNIFISGGASGIPLGGQQGQVLVKASNNNFDTTWGNQPIGIPAGGSDGQVLVKTSNSDYAAAWESLGANQSTENLVQTVYNNSGTTIAKGQVVYIDGGDGSFPTVAKAVASSQHDSDVIGVAAEVILNSTYGLVVLKGIVDGINTDSFVVGDKLYLSPTTDGEITNVKPEAPDHDIFIGYCIKKDIDGSVYVNIDNGSHLDELHDVRIHQPTSGDFLYRDEFGIWTNKPVAVQDISGLSGLFYPSSNPSGFISGIENLVYTTGNQAISGEKIFESSLFALKSFEAGSGSTVLFVGNGVGINNENPIGALDVSGQAVFSVRPKVSGAVVLISGDLANYITNSQTGAFYPASNPSGFITGVDLANYITNSQTGAFYPASNPSGFITGVDLASVGNLVYTTGDQIISGQKTFVDALSIGSGAIATFFVSSGNRVGVNTENPQASLDISGSSFFSQRPLVNGTGVLLEGEIQSNTIISGVVYSAQVNVKNFHGSTIYKGQPVYIKGAEGGNILVGLAANTGEATSSKTLGLVVQDSLLNNASGTVITDGLLSNFDVGTALAGDPVWLGPSGNLLYGLANKPYASNHLVYLGVVTRQNNNGEIFVKVQNGYELEELHNVAVTGAVSGQFLYKQNSQWSAKNIGILDVSGLQSSLDSKQVTGNYYPATNPSGFITGVNLTNYITTSQTGAFYPTTNPSGFITGVNLTNYITTSQTGAFYPASNPSGFIGSAGLSGYVATTGDQTISGIKIFASSPLETKASPAISAGVLTLDLSSASLFYVNLNASITTLTLTNTPASPNVFSFTLQFVADGTARTVAWPASFRWAASTPPTLTSTLNRVDTFTFLTHDGGTNWFAYTSNQNQ